MPERRYLETETIRLSIFETPVPENPLNIRPYEILKAFDDMGVVLIRGFNFDLTSFEAFTRIYCDKFSPVSYRHKRSQMQGDGYSYEVIQENYMLLGHTEGTFRPYPPSPEICFFVCSVPPEEPGGETILIDGIKFLEHLPTILRDRFIKTGITYEIYLEKERWQQEFSIEDISTLNALLTNAPGVRYTIQNDALHLFYTTAAITRDRNGSDVFSVALLGHLPHITHPDYLDKKVHTKPTNRVYFGDGEELSDEIINELIDIHDTLAYSHRWQTKDMLLIDNTRYLHGRTMTQRPCERKIISRFGWLKPFN